MCVCVCAIVCIQWVCVRATVCIQFVCVCVHMCVRVCRSSRWICCFALWCGFLWGFFLEVGFLLFHFVLFEIIWCYKRHFYWFFFLSCFLWLAWKVLCHVFTLNAFIHELGIGLYSLPKELVLQNLQLCKVQIPDRPAGFITLPTGKWGQHCLAPESRAKAQPTQLWRCKWKIVQCCQQVETLEFFFWFSSPWRIYPYTMTLNLFSSVFPHTSCVLLLLVVLSVCHLPTSALQVGVLSLPEHLHSGTAFSPLFITLALCHASSFKIR